MKIWVAGEDSNSKDSRGFRWAYKRRGLYPRDLAVLIEIRFSFTGFELSFLKNVNIWNKIKATTRTKLISRGAYNRIYFLVYGWPYNRRRAYKRQFTVFECIYSPRLLVLHISFSYPLILSEPTIKRKERLRTQAEKVFV